MARRSLTNSAALLILAIGLDGCGGSGGAKASGDADPWEYALRLGVSRARVHELLGSPYRTSPELEEYPASGVTVSFDPEGRVVKLNFAGEAAAIYTDGLIYDRPFPPNLSPSDRTILFCITSHADEAAFRRALGKPIQESLERSESVRERRCIWRIRGYIIDGLFLVVKRSHEGATFASGTLLWFEVTKGL